MDPQELKLYLAGPSNEVAGHLENELKWLLRAATEWHVQQQIQLGEDGYHMQVYAMDSTFLHARTLFEFFTQPTTQNYYGCNAFGLSTIPSSIYRDDWKAILHAYMMHAQDRSQPRQLKSFDGQTEKDLNRMPVDFAREVVRLWREFAVRLGSHNNADIKALRQAAEDILNGAIDEAEQVVASSFVKQYGVKPLAW